MKTKLKKTLQIALVVCLAFTSVAGSAFAMHKHFADAQGHWAEDIINQLANKGIVAGYPDGLVRPDNIITRSEFSVLVARTMELTASAEEVLDIEFTDIKDHWAEKDIEALVAEDIIEEQDYSTEFFPNDPITRYEMIRMLTRALGDVPHKVDCTHKTDFTDLTDLTSTQLAYICTAERYGITDGFPDGTLRPFWNATRAEAFTMLVSKDKAIETIKQEQADKEEQDKEDEKPTKPSGGGNSSGGSSGGSGGSSGGSGESYNPTPIFAFDLPQASYVGQSMTLTPESSHVSTVTWAVIKDGVAVAFDTFFDGSLSANGGTIKAKESGNYTIIATATSSKGKTTIAKDSFVIYPVVTAKLETEEFSHTDKAVDIVLSTQNLGDGAVKWTITKDGTVMNLEDVMDGELDNTGGTVFFTSDGKYTLTATVVDGMGKFITTSANILIYQNADISLGLPTTTYTDEPVTLDIHTTNAEDLDIAWSLSRNGVDVEVDSYIEGVLDNEKSIRFKEKGVYKLTATIIDATDRTYKDTTDITVYPVGSAGFYIPEVFHTDNLVMVDTTFAEIGDNTAKWTVEKDGKMVALSQVIDGTLDNDGGSVKFTQAGNYTLFATFTDDGGRTYSYEQDLEVYPIPIVDYSLPEFAHTDDMVTIVTDLENTENLQIEWLVDNTFGYQDWNTYIDGTLDNNGGDITFKRAGVYELVARITDQTGRVFLFEAKDKIEIFPVLAFGFDIPNLAYTDTILDFRTHGNTGALPVDWTITKDGKAVSFETVTDGTLNANGGKLRFTEHGSYVLTGTMTDYLDRAFSHSEEVHIMPFVELSFTMPSTIHYGTNFEVEVENTVQTDLYTVAWTLTKNNSPISFDGTLSNDGGTISIAQLGDFVLTATITDNEGRVFTHSESITVTNTAPTVTGSATLTRTTKDSKFLVNITATATDLDGDKTTLEWDGRTADDYYTIGTHTIKVRAKDIANTYSEWVDITFEVENEAPTTPVITRTPDGNSVPPNTPVTINATATDADGDEITYIWEGRDSLTQTYPLGRNLVRVKAVDSAGAESPWTAIVFFVADSTNGGGMTLTGPDSTINENGIDGATITEYTFTVPSVDGHNSPNDYGRVRGFNKNTQSWEQLNYQETRNGVILTGTLQSGIYTRLEFYYFTDHQCMYNKSNITYSVEYFFE